MSALVQQRERWWSTSVPWSSSSMPDCSVGVTVANSIAGRPLAFPLGVLAGISSSPGSPGPGSPPSSGNFIRHAAQRPDVALVGVDLKAVELAPVAATAVRVRATGDVVQLLLVVAAELRLAGGPSLTTRPLSGTRTGVPTSSSASTSCPSSPPDGVTPLLVSIGRLGLVLGIHLGGDPATHATHRALQASSTGGWACGCVTPTNEDGDPTDGR